jgi:alkylation response protein AidB-like acyl-CoA dehydrogenase
MARDYALERIVFGRQLASFQAIKHKLADIYCEIEIARSNAYYGAWALAADNATALSFAAAMSRLAASSAYFSAAKENIQVHGGFGFTAEYDCHLFYRRCKLLSLALGGQNYWEGRLAGLLESGAQDTQYGL